MFLVLSSREEITRQCQRGPENHRHDGRRAGLIAGGLDALNGDGRLRLVLLDLGYPPVGGCEAVKRIRRAQPDVPFVLFRTAEDFSAAVETLESGDGNFTLMTESPAGFGGLAGALLDGARPERPDLTDELMRVPAYTALPQSEPQSPKMRAIRSIIHRVSQVDVPVLLAGETGVGKEALARELHSLSPRACKPLVKLNCAALPFDLLESELFGYERGAFTGAYRQTQGKFELAQGGTLLLDEIGELDIRLQAKLLHVLQDGEFLRLGGKEMVRVDLRLLAATNCDLPRAVEQGRFRADLYYRLDVIHIELPPLRERKDEIIPLAEHFIVKHAQPDVSVPMLTEDLKRAFLEYDWPGNIRELENLIKRYVVLEDEAMILEQLLSGNQRTQALTAAIVEDCGEPLWVPEECRPSVFAEASRVKTDMESEAIHRALDATHWNRRKAAALLNIEYRSFLYRLKKLGISS